MYIRSQLITIKKLRIDHKSLRKAQSRWDPREEMNPAHDPTKLTKFDWMKIIFYYRWPYSSKRTSLISIEVCIIGCQSSCYFLHLTDWLKIYLVIVTKVMKRPISSYSTEFPLDTFSYYIHWFIKFPLFFCKICGLVWWY